MGNVVPMRPVKGTTRERRPRPNRQKVDPLVKQAARLPNQILRVMYEKHDGRIDAMSFEELLLILVNDGAINPRVVHRPADREHLMRTIGRHLLDTGLIECFSLRHGLESYRLSPQTEKDQRRKARQRQRQLDRQRDESRKMKYARRDEERRLTMTF